MPISSLNPQQLRDLVVRPTLAQLGLPGGAAAEMLVMGTAAQESGLVHLHQLGAGPARGLWQMEPATFRDTWDRWLAAPSRGELRARVAALMAPAPAPVEQLVGNLYLGCAMCRVLYFSRRFTLRESASLEDLAGIWKKYYNTAAGDGTPAQFIANFRRLLAPLYPEV
jgi:hypothetical protein